MNFPFRQHLRALGQHLAALRPVGPIESTESNGSTEYDHLPWTQKAVIFTAMAASSFTIFRWYSEGHLPPEILGYVDWAWFVVSLLAAVAFDLMTVVTIVNNRSGRLGKWGYLTMLSATGFAALVALAETTFPDMKPWLVVGYPITVLCFANHLSSQRRKRSELPSGDLATVSPLPFDQFQAMFEDFLRQQSEWQAQVNRNFIDLETRLVGRTSFNSGDLRRILQTELAPFLLPAKTDQPRDESFLAVVEPVPDPGGETWACPHCQTSLPTKQAQTSASWRGYCPACRKG